MVWQPGQKPRLRISFTPGAGVPAHPAKLTLRLTDYYRRPLFTEPLRVLPVDLGKPLQETVTLDALPPGPYYLTAEIGDGERVFARNRVLFGVAGAAPVPVRGNLPALDPPAVEIAGAVGQYDGLGQRKSRRTVDAVFKNGFNTMQLEYFWGDLEPLPGVYNFSDLDAMVDHVLEQGKFFNITLYFADDQTPEWLHSPEYIMRDQYGSPATGRNFWKMKFFSPPSVSSPLFRQHFAALWGKIAERCAGVPGVSARLPQAHARGRQPALRPETGNLGGAEAPAAAPERAARRGPASGVAGFSGFQARPHPAAVLPRCDPRDPQARAGYEILRLRSVCGRVSARP